MKSSICVNQRYQAEVLGTFMLVLFGVGSAVMAGPAIGNVGVAFGLTLMILVYLLGPISGCHLNPAVSIGLFFLGKLSLKDTLYYCLSQMVGAVLGAAFIYAIIQGKIDHNTANLLAANGYGDHSPGHYNIMAVGLMECMMTAVLLSVIFSVSSLELNSSLAGVVIGLTLVLIHLVSLPVSNTSVNFARSLGPAVFQQGWALKELWLFAIAQFAGVLLATAPYKMIHCRLKK